MRRRSVVWAGLRVLTPYVLAALLGGALAWSWRPVTHSTRVAPALDPLRSSPGDYDWSEQPPPTFSIPPYARFLRDVQIVIDPGHGGRAHRKGWKCGPTGLREAEVNLRVALLLRDLLEAAGARAVLTRTTDVCLDPDDSADLRARITIANELPADLFVSIHHNGSDQTADSNYTSVFYHGSPDHSPASLDAARCLLTGLNEALRLDQHLNCALVSDYAIYPGKGFAVLREARVPALLSEASFHSNPQEERRLRDRVYNRREAYGLFLGLARWACGGLPRVRLIEPADGRFRAGSSVVVELDDGLSWRGGLGTGLPLVQVRSLVVEIDGRPVPHAVDFDELEVRLKPTDELLRKGGRLRVDFANVFGQHVLHPSIELQGGGR